MKCIHIKILHRIDHKLAKFSDKILHNDLICGQYLSKWTDSSEMCTMYKSVSQHIAHVIHVHCIIAN